MSAPDGRLTAVLSLLQKGGVPLTLAAALTTLVLAVPRVAPSTRRIAPETAEVTEMREQLALMRMCLNVGGVPVLDRTGLVASCRVKEQNP